jgi:hypothetical protein
VNTLKSVITDDASSPLTAGLLALPFATLFALLLLHVEPPLGPLQPLLKAEPNVLGSAIVFGAWLLAVVALVFGVAPIVRSSRDGNGVAASRVSLIVAGVISLLVVSFPAALIIDQYPCWIGVPNCD